MPTHWWTELNLVPLVGMNVSGVSCELRKPLGSYVCWYVRLCSRPVGFLASHIPALEPKVCWVGPGLAPKWQPPEQPPALHWALPQCFCISVLYPRSGPKFPRLFRGPSKKSEEVLHQLIWPCFFPWVLVLRRPCVHPSRVKSLFPPVRWSSCTQAPLAFKVKCSRDSSSWCQTPRLGSLT